jgi:hypothetical protein
MARMQMPRKIAKSLNFLKCISDGGRGTREEVGVPRRGRRAHIDAKLAVVTQPLAVM